MWLIKLGGCVKETQSSKIIAYQIMPLKFNESTKMLYYLYQIPLSLWRGSGFKTITTLDKQSNVREEWDFMQFCLQIDKSKNTIN